jgi:RNA polymerase sigma-B factor
VTITSAATAQGNGAKTDTTGAQHLLDEFLATPTDDPRRAARRGRAIEAWMPLARHLAHRYAGRGEPADDLVQTATVGLIKAVDRFEPGRGVDFAGYAIPTILGEVKRHFRDRTWSVRVPRRLQELRLAISQANSTLTHTLNRAPTVADIAAHLAITEEEVLEGLEGARAYNTTSLSAPVGENGDTPLGETFGAADPAYDAVEARLALQPALAQLDEREQRIISLRFFGNLTQSQIAAEIGVSQMHVSRLLTRALARLRSHLDA